jgi:hypothetical protein
VGVGVEDGEHHLFQISSPFASRKVEKAEGDLFAVGRHAGGLTRMTLREGKRRLRKKAAKEGCH